MMKSVRSRLTVTFIGLIAVILAVIWGVNKWYLEDFYVTKKVQALNAMYTAIDAQIAENKDNGITIEEAMERDRDANGNITEGNLQRLIRNFSDSANVSVLIIDNSTEDATVYSTSRDTKFLKDRVDRYIFGWAKAKYTILEENEQYKIQKTYDPQRESMYLESWGFFTDNSTAFIMSAPLSSVGESVRLANQFLLYVGIIAAAIGGLVIYLTARQISKPIYRLSNLSERMSNLDFEAKYEPEKHEMEEIQVLGNSMNTLSERLEETISELKSANNQLTKDIEEKTKIDEMRKEFIANVSHELKTPIAAIMMSLNLLEDKRVGALNDEQEQLSRSIKENSERLLSITGELLNMTQVEAGKLQLMPKITKPIELIEYAIKANQVQADKFNIQIEVEYPEEKIGKLFVDSEKIAWVLTNLLSNAIRYSKENGRVIIGARQDGNIIELYVQDFGKGIDPRYHQSIFDRYFRVPGTKVQGSGLGLSISKDFVEAHGGTLTVESELGKGSRFVMRLKA